MEIHQDGSVADIYGKSVTEILWTSLRDVAESNEHNLAKGG